MAGACSLSLSAWFVLVQLYRPPSIDGQSAVGGPVQYLLTNYGGTVHDSTVLTDSSCGSRKIQV
jgi:hypothetical protein